LLLIGILVCVVLLFITMIFLVFNKWNICIYSLFNKMKEILIYYIEKTCTSR
jgi:hypothetical protein